MTATSSPIYFDPSDTRSSAGYTSSCDPFVAPCNSWRAPLSNCNPVSVISRQMSSSSFGQGLMGFEQDPHSRDSSRARNYDNHHAVYPSPPTTQNAFYSMHSQQPNFWQYTMPNNIQYPTDIMSSYNNFDNQQWDVTAGGHNSFANVADQSLSGAQGYMSYIPNNMPTLTSPVPFQQPTTVTAHSAHSSPYSESATLVSAPQTPTSISALQTPPNNSALLPEQSASVKSKNSHRRQYHLFLKAKSLPSECNTGPFVPQSIYKPHTNSDRKRYVEEVILAEPLYFAMENPSEYGVLLSDALHSRVKRLVDREKPVFEGRGPSVSIRLEWPGYRQWTRQIPTKDFRSPPGPITMAKLAKNIAKCVQRFIDENKDRNLEDGADVKWKVGVRLHEVKLEDLVLVSLHHVSLGSWQPQLRLRRPRQY